MTTFPKRITAILLAALIILSAGSVWYYQVEKRNLLQKAGKTLASINELKINGIREWRRERVLETAQMTASRFFGPLSIRLQKPNPQKEDIDALFLGWRLSQQQRGFDDAIFVNAKGKVLFRLGAPAQELSPESLRGLAEAFQQNKGVITDLYPSTDNSSLKLDEIAPFFQTENNVQIPAGALILQYSAQKFLLPFIQPLPGLNDSIETLLMRRSGNALQVIKGADFQANSAFTLPYSEIHRNNHTSDSIADPATVLKTKDDRNISVLAAVKAIPDTGWFLATRQDETEIIASLRKDIVLILTGILLLLASATMTIVVLWQRKTKDHYQSLLAAETARRKAEERIRSTMDMMLEGCQIIDFDWRQTYINDTALQHSNRTRQELLGHTLLEIYPGIENSEIFAAFRRCMTERIPQHISDTLVAQDNRERWIEISIQPVPEGIFILTNDVTQRKHAEIENNRLASAIEQLGEVVIILDTDRKVQYVNPVFESISGFKAQEIIDTPLPVNEFQNEAFYQKFWETLESGKQWRGRLHNRKQDGTLYIEDGLVSPIFDKSGAIVNYVSITRDITNVITLQEEKEKLQGQYLQAQKMESIGRLAGGVAHDFNNMLNVILGYAQLALDNLKPDHILYSYLDEIQQAANRSADLTRQLLAFARRQTISPVVLNLNQTISDTQNMLKRIIGENIEFVWNPGADLWQVKVDPMQVDQMLANLTVNARDAITGHGRIIIETHNVEFTEHQKSNNLDCAVGKYVLLALSDDGMGMTQEVKDHLFEPFFTTKERGKGTGLGLATVYGIVRQNGGFINVYSEAGQGTTFKIYFPCFTGTEKAEPCVVRKEKPRGGTETVLLVEDEISVLTLTKTILERLGYTTITANSPREALAIVENHPEEIQLLLVDVVMPEMTGRELAEQISARFPKIRKLFMSGYTADAIAHHGVLDEGVSFIQKPFTSGPLAAKIREVLDT